MEKRKLNKSLSTLLRKYKKYLDGSSINEFPVPMFTHDVNKRKLEAEEMKNELAGMIENLIYRTGSEASSFTFADWFYVCSSLPRNITFCKNLLDSAVVPHEKMFALLLALNNWDDRNNSNHKGFRIVFGEDVTPTSWYDGIAKSPRSEFYLLWNLISNFSLGKQILDEQAPWVWGFWKEKCNVPKKLPYL